MESKKTSIASNIRNLYTYLVLLLECRTTMVHEIVNVTATKDGETLEDNADIGGAAFASLLDYADDITVHAVLDKDAYQKKKDYYDFHGFDDLVTEAFN